MFHPKARVPARRRPGTARRKLRPAVAAALEQLETRQLLAAYTLAPVGLPGADSSSIVTMNDGGMIAGPSNYNGSNGAPASGRAYLFRDGAAVDLGSLGGTQTLVAALNNAGQVVGNSNIAGDAASHAFLYSDGVLHDLGTLPGGTDSWASDVNESGQVAGGSYRDDGSYHATLYANGALTDLGTLGGPTSFASGLNDRGQVVGGSDAIGDSVGHAFLYDNGVMTDLGTLDGNQTWGDRISENGVVVGWSVDSSFLYSSFAYEGGQMHRLTLGGTWAWHVDMNAAGQVAGNSYLGGGSFDQHAFLYSQGVTTDLGTLGGRASTATDVNDLGQVVGDAVRADNVTHAFLYTDGAMADLGTLYPGFGSTARHVNNKGEVVGVSYTGVNAGSDAFVYKAGKMLDLNALIPSNSGWQLTSADFISDDGVIAGYGYYNGVYRPFLLTPRNADPVAASDAATGAEDATLSGNVLANDSDPENDPVAAQLLTSPQHGQLTLDADGSFTYTPAPDFFGTDTFTYRANDAFGGHSDPATVTLTVTPVNDAPTANDDAATVTEDVPLLLDVLANDSAGPVNEGQGLAIVSFTQPAHGVVDVVNGRLRYTPSANYHGTDAFSYTARDTDAADPKTASAAVSLVVTPQNDAPVIAGIVNPSTPEDTALDIDLRPFVRDVETAADDLRYTLAATSDASRGTIVATQASGVFHFTPAPNFFGSFSFTFRVTDTGDPAGTPASAASSTAAMIVFVTPVNDAPVANPNKTFTVAEDAPLSVSAPGVLAGDIDVDGNTLTTVQVTAPAHSLFFRLNLNGSFTYTPAPNFNGADSFVYQDSDGQGGRSQPVTVTINVTPVNDAPVLRPLPTRFVSEGSPVAFDAVADDVDGDPLTYSLLGDVPAGVTLDAATGAFRWITQDSGTYTFTLRATDTGTPALSSQQTFSVAVSNVAPTATLANPGPVAEGAPVIISLAAASDPSPADTAAGLHYSFALSPAGLATSYATATDPASKNFTFPDNGVYTVYARVFDKDNASTQYGTFLVVNNVAPTPSIDSISNPRVEGTTISATGSATDPAAANDALTYDWAVFKDGSATPFASAAGTTLAFTPDDDGDYRLVLTARDDDGGSASTDRMIHVDNAAPTDLAVRLDNPVIDENGRVSLTGTFADPGVNDTHTVTILWPDGQAETLTLAAGVRAFASARHVIPDDFPTGTASDDLPISVTVTDGTDAAATRTRLTVNNVAPQSVTIDRIAPDVLVGPAAPGATYVLGTRMNLSGSFADPGPFDTHTFKWVITSTSLAQPVEIGGALEQGGRTVASSFKPTVAGVYHVRLVVTDDDLGTTASGADATFVIYDPTAGFLTGSGWFDSPAGAVAADPTLTGKATFGFSSKYQKGAAVPTGDFQFKLANLSFKSTAFDWMVVAGATAQLQGTGTINGQGGYAFLLTVVDGGPSAPDQLRLQIWDTATGQVVYDNQGPNPLGGGNVAIQA